MRSMRQCAWGAIALLMMLVSAGPAVSAAQAAEGETLATLERRLRRDLVEGAPPSAERVSGLVTRLSEGGRWPGLNYQDQSRSRWEPARHVNRLVTLAKAYRHPGSEWRGRDALGAAIRRGLSHWLEADYRAPNWWYNVIGVPLRMARMMLLVGDDLPDPLREAALKRIGETGIGMTGQNRVWVASIVLMRGLMRGEPEQVAKARSAILGEVEVTTGEGLQPDFSFHQHGPQLMSWSYGRTFLSDSVHWWGIFEGTRYELSDQRKRLIRRFVLDGIAWSAWRGAVDVSLRGRNFTRGPSPERDGALLSVLDRLRVLSPAHASTYRRLERFHRGQRAEPVLVGNRHFWRSDYMAHRRPGWFGSVRMHSARTRPTETDINSENVKGHYLADGALMVYRSGREYRNVYPVWDWQKIPGVTAPDYDGHPHDPSETERNGSRFVGGVSGGRYGAAVMRLRRRGVEAQKAWFFFDGAIACLGSGIRADRSVPVVTTLSQRLQEGEVRVKPEAASAGVQQAAKRTYPAAGWLHHDGVGYLLLGQRPLTVTQRQQRGSWRSINRQYSEKPVSERVFSAWVSHGPSPEGGSYAYLVMPGVEAGRMTDAARSKPVRILANTTRLQAAADAHKKLVQAVFHEAGALETEAFGRIRVGEACAVIVREDGEGLVMHVADPAQQLESVRVTVNGEARTVELPGGAEAGRTRRVTD